MARRRRFLPESRTLVSITCRTVQGRFLLRPSPQLNDTVLGVLGRAQRLRPIEICAVSVLSNHLHLLVVADDARQVADFMEYAVSNLAREVNRLTGWSGPVFQGRYSMIVVTDEEAAQVERLRYVLSQSCKENLVERPGDWPGVGSTRALLEGEALAGLWLDRTLQRRARGSAREADPDPFETPEQVTLSALPCWRHLPPESYRERVAELVTAIEREAAGERTKTGSTVLGAPAVLSQHPHHRPAQIERSAAPLVHAATRAARQAFRGAYRRFVAAFCEAAERLRRGDLTAAFPIGSFPPGLPFVTG